MATKINRRKPRQLRQVLLRFVVDGWDATGTRWLGASKDVRAADGSPEWNPKRTASDNESTTSRPAAARRVCEWRARAWGLASVGSASIGSCAAAVWELRAAEEQFTGLAIDLLEHRHATHRAGGALNVVHSKCPADGNRSLTLTAWLALRTLESGTDSMAVDASPGHRTAEAMYSPTVMPRATARPRRARHSEVLMGTRTVQGFTISIGARVNWIRFTRFVIMWQSIAHPDMLVKW